MEDALRDLRLIETLGFDGVRLVRLERHLERLEASARVLGWRCDRREARASLSAAVHHEQRWPDGPEPRDRPQRSEEPALLVVPPADRPPDRGPAVTAASRHDERWPNGSGVTVAGVEAVEPALLVGGMVPGPTDGRARRVRLTLDADGRVDVTTAPMPAPITRWRIALADARVASDDPWLRLKTTRRPLYDRLRAEMAALGGMAPPPLTGTPSNGAGDRTPALDELLVVNERGEVCEGTITNVFFDLGDGWLTPPLASGCLPGVLREELLATGRVREGVLAVDDLPRARLRLGNSLRGWAPADLADRPTT